MGFDSGLGNLEITFVVSCTLPTGDWTGVRSSSGQWDLDNPGGVGFIWTHPKVPMFSAVLPGVRE